MTEEDQYIKDTFALYDQLEQMDFSDPDATRDVFKAHAAWMTDMCYRHNALVDVVSVLNHVIDELLIRLTTGADDA